MKPKWIVAWILCLAMSMSMIACGQANTEQRQVEEIQEETEIVTETEPAFDLEAFKAAVALSTQIMYDDTLYLYVLGKYEAQYWKTSDNFGANTKGEDVAKAAFKWLDEQEKGDVVDFSGDYDTVRQQYKEIYLQEVEGKEVEKIMELYLKMYENYCNLYKIVMMPQGTQSSFDAEYKKYGGGVGRAYEDLGLFLDRE